MPKHVKRHTEDDQYEDDYVAHKPLNRNKQKEKRIDRAIKTKDIGSLMELEDWE